MGFRFRKTLPLGPLRLNFGKRGYTSTTLKFGPLSRNSRTGKWTLDLWGPFSWTWGGPR